MELLDILDGGDRRDGGRPLYDPGAYGRDIAPDYDDLYQEVPDTERTVEQLIALAGPGPILEMGIGTGRLALPLQARGYEVAGIEGSPEMVDVLRAKPDGQRLRVAVGDFADTRVEGCFTLVVLALHTIFGLPSTDEQIRCFENAADHLSAGGRFVVEGTVVEPAEFHDGQTVRSRFSGGGHVELQVQRYDPVSQRMEVTNLHLGDGQPVRTNSYVNQYATPRELDLMARIAGFSLEERWEDWYCTPFTGHSRSHVSIYRLGDTA